MIHPEVTPVWLTECKNPRTNFFFSAFCMTSFFSAAFWGHVLQMWQQVAV